MKDYRVKQIIRLAKDEAKSVCNRHAESASNACRATAHANDPAKEQAGRDSYTAARKLRQAAWKAYDSEVAIASKAYFDHPETPWELRFKALSQQISTAQRALSAQLS